MRQISGCGGGPGVVLSHASGLFLRHLFRLRIPRVGSNLVAVGTVTHVPKRETGITIRSCSSHVSPINTYIKVGNSHVRNVIHRLEGRGVSIVGCASGVSLFVRHTLDPTGVSSVQIGRRRRGTRICLHPRRISLTVNGNNLGVGLTYVLARCTVSIFHSIRNTSRRSVCLSRFSSRVSD